jgi:DNA repair protein RecN (Recombination protein N)
MLRQLTIQNIILIESQTLNFEEGLNIITGETGAGKSSIISALRLILGDRSDFSQIRKGEEKASVVAIFDIKKMPHLRLQLEEMGIDHLADEPLIIKKELSTYKSRNFINHQQVQLTAFETIGKYLISHIHQMASTELFSLQNHLEMLDQYCGTDIESFKELWVKLLKLKKELNDLNHSSIKRIKEKERLASEISEISSLKFSDSEDEALFKRFEKLHTDKIILTKIRKILSALFETKPSFISLLIKTHGDILEECEEINELKNVAVTIENIQVELHDVQDTLLRIEQKLKFDESELEFIEQKLAEFDKIKKKFGSTLNLVRDYENSCRRSLELLKEEDLKIEALEKEIPLLEKEADEKAFNITMLRKKFAPLLQQKVEEELKQLNMPNARFQIEITSKERGLFGDEKIEFLFAPNKGEKMLGLKDAASGGEMSRVLLALKGLLTSKEKIPTIIFDEIDAHLGGITATVVGEKIEEISTSKQVICITHLPQVAKRADNHIHIKKIEKDGRTFTQAFILDEKSKKSEFARMLGIKSEEGALGHV